MLKVKSTLISSHYFPKRQAKSEKRSEVSSRVFHGYLYGGRTWPQVRGPANVAVIHAWSQEAKRGKEELLALAGSKLCAQQIKIVKASMLSDHQMAGVEMKVDASDRLMEDEWLKTKHAALLSIGQFAQKKIEKDAVPLSHKGIVQYAKGLELTSSDMAILKREAALAYSLVFKKHLALGKIFKMALFKPHLREFYFDRALLDIASSYGIARLDEHNAASVQQACSALVLQILKKELSQSPVHPSWIAWGFESSKKQ